MTQLQPHYSDSHALIIGTDDYDRVSPLQYAVSDAHAIAHALVSEFNFPKDNVKLLINQDGTRQQIHRSIIDYSNDSTGSNDRLVIFFCWAWSYSFRKK